MVQRADSLAQPPSPSLVPPESAYTHPQSYTGQHNSLPPFQHNPYPPQHNVIASFHTETIPYQQISFIPPQSCPNSAHKNDSVFPSFQLPHYGSGNQIIPLNDQSLDAQTYHPVFGQTFTRSPSPPARLSVVVDLPSTDFTPEPVSATTATSSTFSQDGDLEQWPSVPSLECITEQPLLPHNSYRRKPYIELSSDQPLTTKGNPRARVFVACLRCRTRKIRCDGAKPICHNCSRRSNGGDTCIYDLAPKRRGPDKNPSARKRAIRDLKNKIQSDLIQAQHQRRTHRVRSPPERLKRSALALHWGAMPSPVDLPPPSSPLLPSPRITHSLPQSPQAEGLDANKPSLSRVNSLLPVPFHSHGSLEVDVPCAPSKPMSQASLPQHSFMHCFKFESSVMPSTKDTPSTYTTEINDTTSEGPQDQEFCSDMVAEPSLDFTHKIWWDSLLSLYFSPTSKHLIALTPTQREVSARGITSDLRFLFRTSSYWFSFIHVPSFFETLFDPSKRQQMQPSLLLSLLSLATFWQSSEIGRGNRGRENAVRFRDEAQAALEASLHVRWVDDTLAQAAWLLAMFEICAHPYHSTERSASSMNILDSIIRSLRMTRVDNDDLQTSKFAPHSVPAVNLESLREHLWSNNNPVSSHHSLGAKPSFDFGIYSGRSSYYDQPPSDCYCASLTLGPDPSTPLWSCTPVWPSLHEGEIRKESRRRLCWSSITLAAGHLSYSSVSLTRSLKLFIADPANHALLFTGESTKPPPALRSLHSPKETIWALHDRAFLLWHSCMLIQNDPTATEAEKARFGLEAWLEADILEKALNRHTCGLEKSMIFLGREYLFNIRIVISHEFQQYIPVAAADFSSLFHRKKAEEWLIHQTIVATRLMAGLHTVTGNAANTLSRRPFFVFWFMGQISRALSFWACDRKMTVALDLCKALLPPIDYLTALWPCPEQRLRYNRLRERLEHECELAGLPPIPRPKLTLSDTLV